jgi:hypothetical protein
LRYNSTNESKNATIQIKLSIDILTVDRTFCKVTTIDEGVKYLNVEMINSRIIQCFIEKKLFTSIVDVFDIQLWVNASQTFDLSFNNQSFLFVKEELTWNHQRVFNPELKILTLNYLIPSRRFTYNVELIGFNEFLKCNFSSENFVKCETPLDYLKTIESIPLNVQFKLHITSVSITTSISVQYLTYYEFTSIQHLKPFMITYFERLNNPLRITSNTMRSLNSKSFQFFCNSNYLI